MSADPHSLPGVRAAVALVERRGAAVTTSLFAVAYTALCATGQAFSTAYLQYGWQIVPWSVLRDDPLGSVWYLHTQPPLWNLVLGGAAKLSPLSDALTLRGLMVVLALATTWLLFDVLRAFGLRAVTALVLTLAMLLNPEVLQWVFGPTYELAITFLLVLTVRTAQRCLEHRRGRDLVWCSLSITALVLTRSLYHPLLIVLVVGALAIGMRRQLTWKPLVAACAIPLLLVGGWMVKNEVLFGRATLSSWLGMNLQRSTLPILPADELHAMHDAGELSDIAILGHFGNYDLYKSSMPPCTPTHDHPAVTMPGHLDHEGTLIPNFNYECFLPIYDKSMSDFWAVATAHPSVWLEGRFVSTKLTFATSTVNGRSPSILMRGLDRLYRLARVDVTAHQNGETWGSPLVGLSEFDFPASLVTAALYVVLLAYGVLVTWRSCRRWRRRTSEPASGDDGDGDGDDPHRRVVLGTIALVALLSWFTIAVGVVAELGEQARFRSVCDPLALAIAVVLTARVLRRWLAEPTDAPARAE